MKWETYCFKPTGIIDGHDSYVALKYEMSNEKNQNSNQDFFFRVRRQVWWKKKARNALEIRILSDSFGAADHVSMSRGHEQEKWTKWKEDKSFAYIFLYHPMDSYEHPIAHKRPFFAPVPGNTNHLSINWQINCQCLISHTWILHGNYSTIDQNQTKVFNLFWLKKKSQSDFDTFQCLELLFSRTEKNHEKMLAVALCFENTWQTPTQHHLQN